jgi:hypothetical protein
MGWVDVDVGSSEKMSLQDLYPPATARNGTPTKGRWGVGGPPSDLMDLRSVNLGAGKYSCRTYTPMDLRSVNLGAGKYSCRTYTPPRRHGSFHLLKDDGVGVNELDIDNLEVKDST